ncbi:sodium/proline symporter [bacterium]|nr:sodium/proline symporter [bacterium]
METAAAPVIQVSTAAVIAFIAYLGIITSIGIFTAKFSSGGLSEFFLGGRKMNRLVVALSAVVSGRSSWLLIGVTGMAYTRGASALWAVVGYILVEFLLFFFYAPRLRRFSEHYDSLTLPDFFATRFNDRNGVLRGVMVLIIILFLGSYVSAQFVGGGKAFAASFGVEGSSGILITAGIVLVYTLLGGFLAVSLTDMLQAFFMLFALLILPILAIADQGGWAEVTAMLNQFDPTFLDPMAIGLGALIGFAGIGLGSPGNPHILVRYMSIDDPKQLKYSAYVGTIWNVLMAFGAVLIGLVGRTYFATPDLLGGDTENLYPMLAQQHLHPVLFGIVVASIFAAIMSTADSQLLVVGSSVVVDIYEKLLRKGKPLPHKQAVLISRVVILVLVVAALTFGMLAKKLVFWLVLFAWAGLGASLGPTSILALFWKRTTRAGILAGMLTGTVVTIVWYYTPALKGALYELIPGFLLGALATVVVSLLTKPPDDVDRMMNVMRGND